MMNTFTKITNITGYSTVEVNPGGDLDTEKSGYPKLIDGDNISCVGLAGEGGDDSVVDILTELALNNEQFDSVHENKNIKSKITDYFGRSGTCEDTSRDTRMEWIENNMNTTKNM